MLNLKRLTDSLTDETWADFQSKWMSDEGFRSGMKGVVGDQFFNQMTNGSITTLTQAKELLTQQGQALDLQNAAETNRILSSAIQAMQNYTNA